MNQIYDSSCTVLLGTVLKFGQGAGLDELGLDIKFENPVQDELRLLGETSVEVIQITDLSGKTFEFKSLGNNIFDTTALPAGFYILTAVNKLPLNKPFIKA